MHGSGDPEVRAGQRLYGSRNAQMNIAREGVGKLVVSSEKGECL